MYAYDFAARCDTSAVLLSFLGTGPAMAAGNAAIRLINGSLASASDASQVALGCLRGSFDVRGNPFLAEQSLSVSSY
jgi:hypothetical protein